MLDYHKFILVLQPLPLIVTYQYVFIGHDMFVVMFTSGSIILATFLEQWFICILFILIVWTLYSIYFYHTGYNISKQILDLMALLQRISFFFCFLYKYWIIFFSNIILLYLPRERLAESCSVRNILPCLSKRVSTIFW